MAKRCNKCPNMLYCYTEAMNIYVKLFGTDRSEISRSSAVQYVSGRYLSSSNSSSMSEASVRFGSMWKAVTCPFSISKAPSVIRSELKIICEKGKYRS